MNRTVFESPVSGHNVFAGLSASSGGIINVHLGANPKPIDSATGPFSTVPFPPDPNFVERPAVFQWLRSTLVGPGCRAALVGLGGVGKSQIAIQYAHNVRQIRSGTYVLWVHASSSARFQEAYQDIAERLKLPGRDDPQQNVLRLVYHWLSEEKNGPWLMIIDNADDSTTLFSSRPADHSGNERSLASYIPKTGQGSVLVTSRSLDAAEELVGDDAIYQLPVMERDQAIQLLQARLGKPCEEDRDIAGLLAALDYLPLAIIQAVSYIKRRSVRGATISSYLQEFRTNTQKRTQFLAREAKDQRRDPSASNAVVTTWQITFNQVRRDRASAAELLCFMSFFNPRGIPDFVLKVYSNQGEAKDLEDDIEVLLGYSLITTIAEGRTLKMHALVQFCTQAWLSTFDDKERWRSKFLGIMSSQYPFGSFENWTICLALDAHIEETVNTYPTAQADIVSWTALLHNAAVYRLTNGKPSEAEEMNRQALEARTKTLGSEHPHTLASMSNLVLVLLAQGKNNDAEKMSRQALEIMTKVLGAEDPTTLTCMGNRTLVLQAEGKYGEAEKISRQALEAKTKVLGTEHLDTITGVNNLASVLHTRGKNSEAEAMNRQALEAMTKALGTEHPDTLRSTNHLAVVLQAEGKYGEAEKINRQTLEARMQVLGAEHPDTLTSVNNLASVLHTRGKNSEAKAMNRQALEAMTKILGAEHPETLTSMSNLASVLRVQGEYGEAEKINWQTLEARRKVLGAEHLDTLMSMNNLAFVLYTRGKNSEAEKINRQTLEAMTKALGAGHPTTLTSMSNLVLIYKNQGRWEEAGKLEVQVMETRKTRLGADHFDTLTSMSNLVLIFQNQGRWEEAEKLNVQVMETCKTKLGADHPDTLISMSHLASIYKSQGRFEEAETLNVQMMETARRSSERRIPTR